MSKRTDDGLKKLRSRIAKLPASPGVYRWLNADGDVLYVGKAKDLRARLKNYVAPDAGKQGPWKEALMRSATDVEATVVRSELEAFVLETNLIKELRPKYNILMKDDKNFVYVRITVQDAYPRIEVVRQMLKDKALYIGPKTSQYQVQRTLDMLRALYPFRTCKMSIAQADPSAAGIPLEVVCKNKDRPTPCLDHHIGQCAAPCAGLISERDYRERCIDPVIRFLRGDQGDIVAMLREKMARAAQERKFEQAAKLRDVLQYIEELSQKQAVSDTSRENADVAGVALLSGRAQVVLLRERDGKLIDDVSLELAGSAESAGGVLAQVLPQFYATTADFPRLLVLPEAFDGMDGFAQWLGELAGRKVELRVPERGKQSTLLKLAMHNAAERAKQREAKWEAEHRMVEGALTELQHALSLPAVPKRIEGYDISHLGGTETAGSMSVFVDGKPQNKHYRHFTIHGLKAGEVDDYRSLREVLRRRLKYAAGGLQGELDRCKENGMLIEKAKKADQETLERIAAEHPGILSSKEIDYRFAVVARKDGGIVGTCRLRTHGGALLELAGVWVREDLRGRKLGHAMTRLLFSRLKKREKVYVRILPALTEYYALLGFRHVLEAPKLFREIRAKNPEGPERMVMVYDCAQHQSDASLGIKPDLLLIDGGKGQLGVAVDVLKELGLSIPVIGLAKREEELFVPGGSAPLDLPKESPARYLLMRLRDEAHRFANRLREQKAKNTLLGK